MKEMDNICAVCVLLVRGSAFSDIKFKYILHKIIFTYQNHETFQLKKWRIFAVKIMRFLLALRHLRLYETLSGTNALWSHEGRWFDGWDGMRLPCSLPTFLYGHSPMNVCFFFVIMTYDMEVQVHYHQFIHGGSLVIWKSISWIKSGFVLPEGWQISFEITLTCWS